MSDTLFPALPKELTKLSDTELADLLAEHEQAAGLIDSDDAEFLKDLSADEIIEQYRGGAEQIKALKAEVTARADAAEAFTAAKAEIAAELKGESDEKKPEDEAKPEDEKTDPVAEVLAEAEKPEPEDEPEVEEKVEKKELAMVASAETETATNSDTEVVVEEKPRLRRVPVPAADRVVVSEKKELGFVASGFLPTTPPGTRFADSGEIVGAMQKLHRSLGKPTKTADGREERFPVAQLDYADQFPEERRLDRGDWKGNGEKIAAIGNPYLGTTGMEALVASGGLCAPLTPIYTMPQLATAAIPVWDSLPTFRAERGGVNVPTPTTIDDADGSVTVITEAEDALGGTFATKACLTMDCPDYTETAVTIISACREFGNLNAMAWPEKIQHELELTRAFHARTSEGYILDQIKALSVNVTVGVETLGALIYLVDGIAKSAFGIRSRLRLPREVRFQALLPAVLLDILLLDTVQTQFDRYRTREDISGYLSSVGVDVTWYLDTPSDGTSQIADSAQTAAAIDPFPDNIQGALFPAGTFLGIDMAELNLGLVRDSTLNSTNDFQYFWETFKNVARIGPAQAAYWVTFDLCASGQYPPAGTVRTCD